MATESAALPNGTDVGTEPARHPHLPSEPPQPTHRLLRGYAFDPSMATKLETALVSEITYKVPWEDLEPGPVGGYVEVVDYDPPSGCFYAPVELNHLSILAQNGLQPSEGNPQFHQQMVYAVAMTTIDRFERALGRKAFWTDRYQTEGSVQQDEFVPRLRIYPHALRMANAYYSRNKGSLLFGYFPATEDRTSGQYPGGMVFTCLSHDVIAHETTHALLDGFHKYFMEATNPDVLAFHEAFADIIALFQHFTFPDVLAHQIAKTRGDLSSENLLAQLAIQFGHARGTHGALRDAIGKYDPVQNKWIKYEPEPGELDTTMEVHARGAIYVAAVFDAFLLIYRGRTHDLLRLASGGTGVLPLGELHPDLVNRLAQEAAKAAGHVLNMCIRALDYCPPVDITFGHYLRAIITADFDLVPNDVRNYRVAFVEAFRRYGIFPANVGTLSVDTLLWPEPDPNSSDARVVQEFVQQLASEYGAWNLPRDREELYHLMEQKAGQLEAFLSGRKDSMEALTGIDPNRPFTVHSIWPRECVSPSGDPFSHWVIEILQEKNFSRGKRLAGCTLIVDADTGLVRHAVHKATGRTKGEQTSPDLLERFSTMTVLQPVERRLRVFAFDPSLATQLETARINQVTLHIPWESITQGPVGEYLEVVDYDPASGCFYDPVDLDDKYLIAEDGYAPSQANPQFHQQMVYAVAMRTIRNFEHALGRLAL